jgi:dTDP-4-amino-4,6-dideoxygalactose transaminase
MKPISLIDLAAVHAEIGDELEAAVLRVCRSQQFVGGVEVERFEQELAEYLDIRHVVGVASGTDALELSLRALGVGPRDEVLIPANTFVATAEAVAAVGARPRFVDVDPASGLLDLASCEERLSSATRAIVPVHLYGRVVDMEGVLGFAAEHDLEVVEDAAQAHGARRGGRAAGTFGRAGCFSFYPTKNLGAFGEAGAVATDDDAVADRIRLLRDHGRRDHETHVLSGRNSRLDAIQAAVLRVKLPHLDRWASARRRIAERYRQLLPAGLLDWRSEDPGAESHHVFPVLHDDRDGLAAHLARAGVQTAVHYRLPLTVTPAFRTMADPCHGAELRAARQLSLPIHPYLEAAQVAHIAATAARAPGRSA